MTAEAITLPILGRVGATQPDNAVHLFGPIGTPGRGGTAADLAAYPQFDKPRDYAWKNGVNACSLGDLSRGRLYAVGSAAREVQRYSEDPLAPLTLAQLMSLEHIDGEWSYRDSTELKLQISADSSIDGGASMRRQIDVGHGLELYAERLSVMALQPAGFRKVPPGDEAAAGTESGIVLDVLIWAWAIPIEFPTGRTDAPYTQTLYQPANQAGVIRIPSGARSVSIYRSGLEANQPLLTWRVGDHVRLTTSYPIAAIDFPTTNQTGEIAVPHGATHLYSSAVANPAFHTLVWRIGT